jgi:hypothetical protein
LSLGETLILSGLTSEAGTRKTHVHREPIDKERFRAACGTRENAARTRTSWRLIFPPGRLLLPGVLFGLSRGLFLARLNPGAKQIFEQTEVNSEIWLPKHLFLTGSGRVALLKRLAEDEQIDWSRYRKFSVDSKMVTDPAPSPKN